MAKMKHYFITHKEKAIEALTNHYKNINADVFRNMFYDCDFEVSQIGSCQAWILRDKFGNKYLQSYSTIVSIYFADTQKVERLGRWSVTTSKHQTLFERECR